ncbi:MAG: hypothetical protein SOY06_10900 [Prevotella sp.]|nr:hypothetical protein [Bacteroidales bacterium]MDY4230333.1 hypothetical protein [Prevotella sp.]
MKRRLWPYGPLAEHPLHLTAGEVGNRGFPTATPDSDKLDPSGQNGLPTARRQRRLSD